jgi:RNA polymerase sigma-70 factor (ECF subfamily)
VTEADRDAQTFAELRPLLFALAYRMLASVSEAEDLVQEAFLRFHRSGDVIESPKAYLTTITTRLAIDHLRSARVRRERYVGQWLPEPLVGDEALEADVADVAILRESLSTAFLLVLERLSPVERAVFLLHDVFAFGFDEIARIVDRTPDACRQIAVRARRHVEADRPRFEPSAEERARLAERFFAALGGGDLDGLVNMLADDAVMVGDGGGRGAVRRPVHGALQIARFLLGLGRQAVRQRVTFEPAVVNGGPGALVRGPDGALLSTMAVHVGDGAVRDVYSVVNPDKLRHLE